VQESANRKPLKYWGLVITTFHTFGTNSDSMIYQRQTVYAPIWNPPDSSRSFDYVDEFRLRWASVLLTWIAIVTGYSAAIFLVKNVFKPT